MSHAVLERIGRTGLVPVLRAHSMEDALKLADAIEAGGVDVLEVTMTVPRALDVIDTLVQHRGDRMLIGAGTVLDAETARACLLAGAQFIVSPALDVKTIELCRRYDVTVVPGALTPTEVVTAWSAGADAVKIFPCGAVGGARYLKALRAPLPQVRLIPTGGVSLATAEEYLRAGAMALGVGSELVNEKAIEEGRPEIVTEAAKQYLAAVVRARAAERAAIQCDGMKR